MHLNQSISTTKLCSSNYDECLFIVDVENVSYHINIPNSLRSISFELYKNIAISLIRLLTSDAEYKISFLSTMHCDTFSRAFSLSIINGISEVHCFFFDSFPIIQRKKTILSDGSILDDYNKIVFFQIDVALIDIRNITHILVENRLDNRNTDGK